MILTDKQKKYLYLILFAMSFLYFISSAYITNSNDGSHFALISSIVENRTIKINNFINYTKMMDYAVKNGNYYSDRVPGTAFLGVPFYVFGKIVYKIDINHFLSNYTNIKEVFVIFLPNLAGIIVLLYLFKLFIFFGASFRESMFLVFVFSLGTPIWFEATHLFSHIISMAAVFLAAYYALEIKKVGNYNSKYLILISILLALASIIEIQNILFLIVFLIYFLISKKINIKNIFNKHFIKLLILLVLIFISIYASLIVYNHSAFNEFTIKSNKYNPNFLEEKTFLSSMSGNFLIGIDRLTINSSNKEVIFNWSKGIKNEIPGLFILAPIFILSLFGFYYFAKEHKKEALFFGMLILTEIFIVALHKTVLTRHISTILPYLFFPIFFIFQKSLKQIKKDGNILKRYWLLMLILFLFLLSVTRIFYVMNTYWGRTLTQPFMFLQELPSFFVFYFILYVVYLFIKKTNQYVFLSK